MSISTEQIVKTRIEAATESSKIAVFRTDKAGYFDAVFASTAKTGKIIKEGSQDLVGVFFGESGAREFLGKTA